jgi:rare lipoprotein A
MVNDRGPFKNSRIIDLSHGAARKIGLHGLAKVKVDYLGWGD